MQFYNFLVNIWRTGTSASLKVVDMLFVDCGEQQDRAA